METKFNLPTSDGHIIYGVTNSEVGNKKALFIVHGLTGHVYEYAHKRAADYFSAKGYDVYRVQLYWDEPKGRKLVDCTLKIHAEDLKAVLFEYAPQYEKVFLSGHSYGGATVAIANPSGITAVSLWDPTYSPKDNTFACFKDDFLQKTGFYIVSWHTQSLIGQDMYREAEGLDESACANISKLLSFPVQVNFAENGKYIQQKKSWDSDTKQRTERNIIKGTTHCFYEGNSCDELLEKTFNWFERF